MQDTTEHYSNLSVSRLTSQVDGLDNFESLETARDLFEEFQKRVPTLEEAIKEAAFAKVKVEDLRKFINDVKKERKIDLDRLGITDDEVGAIICYTLDSRHGEPYKDINRSLSYSRNRSTLLPMRKFIFLFLNGLRKLDRFRPNKGQELYRAIGGEKVPTEKSEAGGHQCYGKNKTVTWWAFTSTTTDFNVLSGFFNKEKGGKNTIFIIGGEKTWGYDISPFSKLAENEVVLEPETKVKVNGFIDSGDCLTVKVEFQERGKLALGDIITGRPEIVIEREHDDLATITKNVKVLTKIGKRKDYYSVFENTPLSPNTIITRNVRILESRDNNGENIFIGVVLSDVDHNEYENYFKCGWLFSCYDSTLCSGPPHRYKNKEYGPRRGDGEYVHTGDNVGVIMDTTKGKLSFVLNGASLGVAYEEIPLDEPLSLCVLFKNEGDSIELDTSEVKENEVDSSIPVPSNIIIRIACDSITLTWDEVSDASFYQVEVDGKNSGDATTTNTFTKKELPPETEHAFRVRTMRGISVSEWSNIAKGKTFRTFSECAWKECPDDVDFERMYSVDNPRTATKMNDDENYCTIIGNAPIPLNKVTSWSIKIPKSKNNDGLGIYIGVAPNNINQNVNNIDHKKCGWYFDCYSSVLRSGLPHNYEGKEYGPRKGGGEYIHTGDSVGVVMDTTKGELSFVLNNVNHGVAYERIPLDKPLVPCIILKHEGDSVELDISEVKENVDSSIPVPSNFTTKSLTWNSITLTWDEITDASFYQIEADSLVQGFLKTITFTKKELTPETEHTFRVRAVRGSSVSEWSDMVKGKTLKMQGFSECEWKKCPDNAIKKYSLSEKNPRIAKNNGGSIRDIFVNSNYCGIIGNTHVPLNTTTSWNIKVLKSEENNGDYIYIGVAPSDLNPNNDFDHNKCGWYFYCYDSKLCSGPPHNYKYKEYGPRKGSGEYVRTGDSVGIVIDTTRGELSFVLDGVNLGVAYENIPLDKPLVPCVFLKNSGDSVELDTSEVKENVDSSIPVPSNITARNNDTWDTITLTWDEVSDASFYQVEADFLTQEMLKANTFTKRGLYPDTKHNFRVRTVKDNSASEWSEVVEGKTLKAPDFSECEWKTCPNKEAEYYINAKKPRIAKNINSKSCSTIIGNTYIPPNTKTTWSIKIVKSFCKDGSNIYIGVAPFDINLDKLPRSTSCGWYFYCYDSALYSGPPHNYGGNIYGPRKGRNGQYVHDGDSVGVVMDTKKGDLSFALNGVNLGLAYEGIPVDKPLVPCITTGFKNDTVELII